MATKKKKKKKKGYAAAFYPIYPARIGTPRENEPDNDEDDKPASPPGGGASPGGGMPAGGMLGGGAPAAGAAGGGGGGLAASRIPPSKHLVLHELRRAMGVTFEGVGSAVDSNWAGYQTAAPLLVKTRLGGPTIGGPGFTYDPDNYPSGGVIDPGTSPGIGLRSEYGWRAWKAALDVMRSDKTLPKTAIFMTALNRAGIPMTKLDPSEARLIEMGIEWYLSQSDSTQGAAPPVRDGADGSTVGRGAP